VCDATLIIAHSIAKGDLGTVLRAMASSYLSSILPFISLVYGQLNPDEPLRITAKFFTQALLQDHIKGQKKQNTCTLWYGFQDW
jgi:hypothetical protein